MNITSIFEAYLKCPTKGFLCAHGETGAENEYANWVKTETESYKSSGLVRLSEGNVIQCYIMLHKTADFGANPGSSEGLDEKQSLDRMCWMDTAQQAE